MKILLGYGNLAPSTTFTRLFMIAYSLIGIPMNGIVMVTLGEFFARSFVKLYHRWKATRVKYELATFGLVGQICLYLIPGVMFFMILPSIIFMWYEEWTYDEAIYFSFVTLTTIGFGDFVAGTAEKHHGTLFYTCYQLFLFVWVILGLGYVVMILGFITRALRHKKIHEIEHKIAVNLKKTPQLIREELRTILNEFLLMKVKRVYREKFSYVYTGINRSQSCPDLNIYRKTPQMLRKRAFSECIQPQVGEIARIRSDTDLDLIDKDKTFNKTNALIEPSKLILKVVNALGTCESTESAPATTQYGVDLFSDNEILASEKFSSSWSLGEDKLAPLAPKPRKRAISEVRFPFQRRLNREDNEMTWHGGVAPPPLKFKTLQQQMKTIQSNEQGFLSKMKNIFKYPRDEGKSKDIDIEKQDMMDRNAYLEQTARGRISFFDGLKTQKNQKPSNVPNREQLLEETSIADFIRALASISLDDESPAPKRKLGTASLTPPQLVTPPRARHLSFEPAVHSRRTSIGSQAIQNYKRRSSMIPITQYHPTQPRRMSLRPELSYHRKMSLRQDPMLSSWAEQRRFSLKPEPVDDPVHPAPYSASNRHILLQGDGSGKTGRFYVTKRASSIRLEQSPVQRQVAKKMDKDGNSSDANK
ncbi:open rectifier potassium channel protein 1 isoform X2 [Agrilus planipennis]|uniref:Open rectifier potassium channel protein 1 isoform X2 n=1 Tax=Agrilus planipennis TaxID=224129 RepID=A0A1W4WXP4_AGRPL|nr:open rectifier potassium channel protein 1 isoform X2 [Agrilus planipennis]